MTHAVRRKGESFDSFLRRTKLKWKLAGTQLEVRKKQFFKPKKSKNVRQSSAVALSKRVSKTNYLRKTGRLPREEMDALKKRRK